MDSTAGLAAGAALRQVPILTQAKSAGRCPLSWYYSPGGLAGSKKKKKKKMTASPGLTGAHAGHLVSDMRNRRAKLGALEDALGKRRVIYKARYRFVPASTVPSKDNREGPLQFVHSHSHSQSSPQPIRSSFGFCHVPSLDNTCRCSILLNLNLPLHQHHDSSHPRRPLDPSTVLLSSRGPITTPADSIASPIRHRARLLRCPPYTSRSRLTSPPPLGHGRDPRGSLARASWS